MYVYEWKLSLIARGGSSEMFGKPWFKPPGGYYSIDTVIHKVTLRKDRVSVTI